MFKYIIKKISGILAKKGIRASDDTLNEIFQNISLNPFDAPEANSGEEEFIRQLMEKEMQKKETIDKIKEEIHNGKGDEILPEVSEAQVKKMMMETKDYTQDILIRDFVEKYFMDRYGNHKSSDVVYVRAHIRSKSRKKKSSTFL